MFHHLVAPNSFANRVRRWRGLSYRRTMLMQSDQRWPSMHRVIFENVNGQFRFGRVLAAVEMPRGAVRGTIVGRDPGPSHQEYQRANLRRYVSERRGRSASHS